MNSITDLVNNIEHLICCNELSKEQVFTKMKCLIQELEKQNQLIYDKAEKKIIKLYQNNAIREYSREEVINYIKIDDGE